jgi:hypothetical protein
MAVSKETAGSAGRVFSHLTTGAGMGNTAGAFSKGENLGGAISATQTAVSAIGMFKNQNPHGAVR